MRHQTRYVRRLPYPDRVDDRLEAGVATERCVARIEMDVNEPCRARLKGLVQTLECSIEVSHGGVSHGEDLCTEVLLLGRLFEPVEARTIVTELREGDAVREEDLSQLIRVVAARPQDLLGPTVRLRRGLEFAEARLVLPDDAQQLRVESVAPLPSLEELTRDVAIPSAEFPSDHVSLCCDLAWAADDPDVSSSARTQ